MSGCLRLLAGFSEGDSKTNLPVAALVSRRLLRSRVAGVSLGVSANTSVTLEMFLTTVTLVTLSALRKNMLIIFKAQSV